MVELLKYMFNHGEWVCSGKSKYENASKPVTEVAGDECYVTLNPLKEGATRANANVSEYRNFLVEFDKLSLEDQPKKVEQVKMPWTLRTFSGNKSYHFVIALEEDIGKEEYVRLVRWLYAAMPDADPSCKNPSRFTRVPGGTHQEGAHQDSITSGEVFTKAELVEWLHSRCEEPASVDKGVKQLAGDEFLQIQASGYRSKVHKATIEFIKTGGRKGHRHRNLYIAACNLRDCYYTIDEAKCLLLARLSKVYTGQGRESELETKERAIEDAFQQLPRIPNRSK